MSNVVVTPVFRNLSQALHFSFLMEAIPVSTKSSTQIAIEDLRANSGRVFSGHYKSTIDFGGLRPMDVRAQCAMVRSMVTNHLTEPEKHAIWARYGVHDPRCKVFTMVRGIEGVAHYVEPGSLVKSDELLELVSNFYMLKEALTMREIADKYNIPKTNLARAKQAVAQHSVRLEMEAFSKLGALSSIGDLILTDS